MNFGEYGGRYVPEMLITPLEELAFTFKNSYQDQDFLNQLNNLYKEYVGRPSVLYKATRLSQTLHQEYGTPANLKIYLKLESNNHTGAHKINNTVGQILLARKMGKTHIVAETGAGQHGVATAAVCAKFNMKCKVFMGAIDVTRQYPNVFAMRQMGAEVVPVTEGTQTLKDAVNAALKYWVEHVDNTHYLLGSALGPYPYPAIVQFFQSIIGDEVKSQIMEKEECLPEMIMACVGGGSNSLGIFTAFLDDEVRLLGVEAGGLGLDTHKHASRLAKNRTMNNQTSIGNELSSVGIIQGYKSYFLQNTDGQVSETHSISAGLDYAGLSPQLAYLHDTRRVEFLAATDEQALMGYSLLARTEGMIPALESAHALGILPTIAHRLKDILVINVSGRGDKDLFIAAPAIDPLAWSTFLSHELEKMGTPNE